MGCAACDGLCNAHPCTACGGAQCLPSTISASALVRCAARCGGPPWRRALGPSTPCAATTLLSQIEGSIHRGEPVLANSSNGFLHQEVIEHVPSFLSSLRSLQHSHARHAGACSSSHTSGFLRALQRRHGMAVSHSSINKTTKRLRGNARMEHAAPASMQTSLVEGVRLATPTCPRPPSSDPRRALRDADALLSMSRRAHSMITPGATAEQRARLAAGLAHASALAQFGAAEATLIKDDCAWAQWREFSDVYGFDSVVSRAEATQQPDLLSSRLDLFLLWVYPRIRGRGRADAHPRSVLNSYPGAVARVLRRGEEITSCPPRVHPHMRPRLKGYCAAISEYTARCHSLRSVGSP